MTHFRYIPGGKPSASSEQQDFYSRQERTARFALGIALRGWGEDMKIGCPTLYSDFRGVVGNFAIEGDTLFVGISAKSLRLKTFELSELRVEYDPRNREAYYKVLTAGHPDFLSLADSKNRKWFRIPLSQITDQSELKVIFARSECKLPPRPRR